MPARWLSRLHRAEDGLLAALLGSLLLLSVAQIVLRLVFEAGLPWAEPVSRAGVLFLALLGALGATRSGKHIAIDALPRFLAPRPRRAVWAISQVAAAVVGLALAWLAAGMVGMEREAPVPFVAGIPSWVPMLVVPLGFGLMGLRFLVAAWIEPPVAVVMGGEA